MLLGNEFDVLLGDNEANWEAFTELFIAFKEQVKKVRLEAKVGAEITYSGILGKAKEHARKIIELSDLVGISHYPLDENAKVLPPSSVQDIFRNLVHHFPDICYHL